MQAAAPLKYLSAYPEHLLVRIRQQIAEQQLGALLKQKYPQAHEVRTDAALYAYVSDLKGEYMRKSEPLSKVAFDSRIHVIRNALGTHTTVSRVQGKKLRTKREIRVASLFRCMPAEFLRMIVVHELAHMKERDHDKAFYQLCSHMEPDYHLFEFHLRAYLTHLDLGGAPLWNDGA